MLLVDWVDPTLTSLILFQLPTYIVTYISCLRKKNLYFLWPKENHELLTHDVSYIWLHAKFGVSFSEAIY